MSISRLMAFVFSIGISTTTFAASVNWSVGDVAGTFKVKGIATITSLSVELACHFENVASGSDPSEELDATYTVQAGKGDEQTVEIFIKGGTLRATRFLKDLKSCGYELTVRGARADGTAYMSRDISLAGSGSWNAPSEGTLKQIMSDKALNEKISARINSLVIKTNNGVICSENPIEGTWGLAVCSK